MRRSLQFSWSIQFLKSNEHKIDLAFSVNFSRNKTLQFANWANAHTHIFSILKYWNFLIINKYWHEYGFNKKEVFKFKFSAQLHAKKQHCSIRNEQKNKQAKFDLRFTNIVNVIASIIIIIAIYPTITRSRAKFLFSITTLASPFAARIPRHAPVCIRRSHCSLCRRCNGHRGCRRFRWRWRAIFRNAFQWQRFAGDRFQFHLNAIDQMATVHIFTIMIYTVSIINCRTITDHS